MAKLNRLQPLSDAVAASFEAAGFSPAELLQGQIVLTDLSWQAPPLKVPGLFNGVPFSDYVDYPLVVDSSALYDFYRMGLLMLSQSPEEITDSDGYKGLTRVIKRCRSGERKYAFPLFDGWPTGDYITGPMFALEAARLFVTSSEGVKSLKDDSSNYVVDTTWGKVGIEDGYVAGGREQWDVCCTNLVHGMLEQPRGQVTVTCHYDLLARLRSALHQEPARFADFEVLDYALQALRILTDSKPFPELIRAIEKMSVQGFKRRLKIAAYTQALEVMDSWNLTDRAKISMLQEILMPTHMSLQVFSRKILDPHKIFPAVLSKKTEDRIKATLEHELAKVAYTEKALAKESL